MCGLSRMQPQEQEDQAREDHYLMGLALEEAEQARASVSEDMDKVRRELEQERESSTCAICYTNPADVVLVPCGHQCCKTCVQQFTQRRCRLTASTPQLRLRIERECLVKGDREDLILTGQ